MFFVFNSLLIFKTEVEQGRVNDTVFKIFAEKDVIFQIYLL
jgi:hypothetical protein